MEEREDDMKSRKNKAERIISQHGENKAEALRPNLDLDTPLFRKLLYCC